MSKSKEELEAEAKKAEAEAKEAEAKSKEEKAKEELEETKEKAKEIQDKLKEAQISGASESSIHALMEQLREFNLKIDAITKALGSKSKWLPF